jgi:hypothetical protein
MPVCDARVGPVDDADVAVLGDERVEWMEVRVAQHRRLTLAGRETVRCVVQPLLARSVSW